MMAIWLLSLPKVVSGMRVELRTMRSAFFFRSFSSALCTSLLVSRAKATSFCRLVFILPSAAAMSCVGSRSMWSPSLPRLIFWSATTAGLKSATAAQRIAMSQCGKASVAAWYISSQLSTSMRWIAGEHCKATGPATSVTSAPRCRHSSAMAKPILPVE